MDARKYALLSVLLLAVVGVLVGYSVTKENPLLALLSVVIGLVVLRVMRKRVDEVLEDEFIKRISEKASEKTLQILLISCALVGMLLISLGNVQGYPLSYVACAGVLIYLAFYIYYRTVGVE